MVKKLLTALLVAAMVFMATSISWGAQGGVPGQPVDGGTVIYDTTGATWE